MATSTLIQKLDRTALVSNTTGSPGSYSTVSTPDVSNRSQEETFLAGGTIAKGDFVSLDTTKTGDQKALFVLTVDTSGGAVALGVPTVGVALASATAGQKVDVCIAGYCAQANVLNGTAAGIALTVDTTTSGRGVAADAANVNICAVSLTAAGASNTAEVMVIKQF
jgi:hypothetical protein